jgi:predicted ATPase
MLDTCEHVVEAAAATASQLLRSCPSLAVLATSRRPLEVAGEIAWAVPPLDLPGTDSLVDPTYAAESSAVRLLMERAMSVRLDFELTDANVADVVAICAALDGLPLAIELAAARLDVLSPARLRERLHDRFALLDAGHRDAVERQRTLRGAIDWSYELLTGDERRLFQRLAVLPGTFPLELAVALAGGLGPDGVDLLRSLVRQSLVTPHGEDRFVILDTLRAYAEERADAADSALALDRLAQWAATTVAAGDDALRSDAQVDALVALRQDLPNFRVALEWTLDEDRDPPLGVRVAARLAWFWHLTGMYSEGQRWLRTAVAVPDAEPRDRVLALIGAGLHATSVGLLQDGAAFLTRALDDARALDDRFLELLARAQRGGAAWWAGDPDAADADLDPVIDQAAGAHDERLQWIHAYALLQKSRVCLRREDYDAAASLVALADDELELVGDDHLRALAVRFQGRSATLQGSPARGIALAEQALRLSERLSDTEGVAISLLVLGEAQRGLGQFGQATATLGRSIELAVATDHLSTVCQAVSLLAAIDVERGDRERASRIVRELLTAQSEAGLPILTPGGVVQRLVGELLDGYPQAPDVGADPAAARARLRALALETIR